MASLTDAIDDQFVAILEAAYGTSRTIPAGRFRRSADRQSLLDPLYPGQAFDGAYELQYISIADHVPGPSNPFDPAWLRDVTVALRVGYITGVGAAPGWSPATAGSGATAAHATQNARARAIDDAETIWRALNTNFRNAAAAVDPKLCDCRRVGPTAIDDLGNGRIVCTSTFVVWIQTDPANDYVPSR